MGFYTGYRLCESNLSFVFYKNIYLLRRVMSDYLFTMNMNKTSSMLKHGSRNCSARGQCAQKSPFVQSIENLTNKIKG